MSCGELIPALPTSLILHSDLATPSCILFRASCFLLLPHFLNSLSRCNPSPWRSFRTMHFAFPNIVCFGGYHEMGRGKVQIKKLESNSARNATYTKRRAGILKKAKELSILCDIEILLLMFSPNGKPTLCLGEQSDLVQMIAKFYQLSLQEREKSKLEILETLKKTFKNLDHDVKIEDFMGLSDQLEEVIVQELTSHVHTLKAQLAELELRLSYWTDLEKAQSIDHIQHMEDTLRASLNHIQKQKARFGNQLMPLGYSVQFQNSIPLPMAMTNDQQCPHMQLIHGCDGHHFMLSEDAYLAQRPGHKSRQLRGHDTSWLFRHSKARILQTRTWECLK